jgi:hypothetical protein
MSAVATYDALRLVNGIADATAPRTKDDPGATELEVHTLAYLACQLAQWTAPDLAWGYGFHTTSQAEPFSSALAGGTRRLRASGMLRDAGVTLLPTAAGRDLEARLSQHEHIRGRRPFLRAALDAVALLPIPLVLRAVRHDPTVARAARNQTLLDETASHVLDAYYEGLRATVGADASLLSVTELWLQYLVATADQEAA